MWSLNPAIYIRHAWNDTKTLPGKTALVLFYLEIWILIFSNIWQIFQPSSQGMKCVLESVEEGYARDLTTIFFQGMNIFMTFFLFYADKGGLHSWNVGMVASSFFVFLVVGLVGLKTPYHGDCEFAQHWATVFSTITAVFLVTLAGTLFEERSRANGTAEEHQPLL